MEIYVTDKGNKKTLLTIAPYGSDENPGSDGKGLIKVKTITKVDNLLKIKVIIESGPLRGDKWDLKITVKGFSTKPQLTVSSYIINGVPK